MKKLLYTILSVVLWCAIVCYFVFAGRLADKVKGDLYVRNVEVSIKDEGEVNVVSKEMVEGWLKDGGFDFLNAEMSGINTQEVRDFIGAKPFVKDVKVYSDLRGILHLQLSQRRPVARFATAAGYNFYLSDDNWIMPVPVGSAMHVPIVTGNFRTPFERGFFGPLEDSLDAEKKNDAKDYAFMVNLINFVKLTEKDSFWSSQIVQIVVSQKGTQERWHEPEIEIIPRAGNFVVGLGTFVDVEKKLDRLMLFYRNVLPYEGWDNYKYINLKYSGQVVCTK